MPTIIVDKAKGLYQKAATSANPAGTLSGQKLVVKAVDGAVTLTNADSGKIIMLGGAPAYTVQFPVEKGWNAEFLVTGSIQADITLSGSAKTTTTAVSASFTGVCGDGAAAAIVMGTGAGNIGKVIFDQSSNVSGGDTAQIVCVSDSHFVVRAITND